MKLLALLFIALIAIAHASAAVSQITFGPSQESDSGEGTVRELNWMNNNFLDKQRQLADSTIRRAVGRQLHQSRADLRQIQRAIDDGALADADKETLQALGAALGDIFVKQHKKFNWRVYEDELGMSHAVCIDDTTHCLFPMTMLSRRMEAGLSPDVSKVFNTNLELLKSHLPYLPYSRDYSEDLPKDYVKEEE